jgi:ATP-binding cassette, subfamily F, member 3
LQQKEAREEAIRAAYTQQQKEITRKQATIDRFKASASKAKSMKSMQKSLDKIDRIELPPSESRKVNIKLPIIQPSGRIVITVDNVSHSFDSSRLFSNISFIIERNEKVALIAANGVGKTTLLNLIMGKMSLQSGHITFGYNVTPAFFEQDQVRALDPDKTVFETVQYAAPDAPDAAIRNMLGCFLFTKDLIYKKTKVLSGGERNRLSMTRVLLLKANLLILDEPTNHLDIPSKEILLDALKQYQGTLLFVSHDQNFINELATHIIELTPTGAHKFIGNYEQYLDQKALIEQVNNPMKMPQPEEKNNPSSKNNFEGKKEIQRLENQINKIEQEIQNLSLELADYEYGTEEFSMCYKHIEELQKKHVPILAMWEQMLK